MTAHHITSYWVIVGFTEVRFWEQLVDGSACLCLGVTALMHALRKDHCLGKVFGWVAICWLGCAVHYATVAGSLWISPVPSVARAGVSVTGFISAIALWYLAVSAVGFYHPTTYMLAEWTRVQRTVKVKRSRHGVWPQFQRGTTTDAAS